ncbi:hypothetical protein, partial [Rhodococcus sp. LB1]|uniref:hypothetical protein n=1 Tax=Rhodococcus sp. LB1 TaxID=1807499 RepID=UPI000AF56C4B
SPQEWELWLVATRKAVCKHAITATTGAGTPDKRTAPHLIHAHCYHRGTGDGNEHSTSDGL